MGNASAKCFSSFFRKIEVRILMVGLEAAGRTTILYKLKMGEFIPMLPTIGYNVESIKYKNITYHFTDVGGRSKIRPFWCKFLNEIKGIIFVVDSNDRDNIEEAREVLTRFLSEVYVQEVAVLIFANKMELPNPMSSDEITDKLNLRTVKNRKWFVQATSAINGYGLYEGLDWLTNEIRNLN